MCKQISVYYTSRPAHTHFFPHIFIHKHTTISHTHTHACINSKVAWLLLIDEATTAGGRTLTPAPVRRRSSGNWRLPLHFWISAMSVTHTQFMSCLVSAHLFKPQRFFVACRNLQLTINIQLSHHCAEHAAGQWNLWVSQKAFIQPLSTVFQQNKVTGFSDKVGKSSRDNSVVLKFWYHPDTNLHPFSIANCSMEPCCTLYYQRDASSFLFALLPMDCTNRSSEGNNITSVVSVSQEEAVVLVEICCRRRGGDIKMMKLLSIEKGTSCCLVWVFSPLTNRLALS